MNTILSLQDVSVRYSPEAQPVLYHLSAEIKTGEKVALLGLNGSGKTTLLYSMVGLIPHEGIIELNGLRLTSKTERRIRDRIGFLFSLPEDQILFPKVVDDVAFSLERKGIERGEACGKALQLLERLGVSNLAESPPHRLSHGQRQRVALAGALAAEPSLLLFDEPSSALDPIGKKALITLLQETPATMILATNDMGFASRLCNRFIVLEKGSIVEDTVSSEKISGYWER